MNVQTGHAAGAPVDGSGAGDGVPTERALPWGEVLAAGVGLAAALKRSAAALVTLFVAEARITRASLVVVFLGAIALVAFAVSLWACVAALVGWALVVATHSIGAALGILVALHLLLVMALWLLLKRALHQAGFPALRVELGALRGELRQTAGCCQHASPPTEQEPLA